MVVEWAYADAVIPSLHIDFGQYSAKTRWFMTIAWVLIVAKCAWVAWAIPHWNVPIHPIWIIGPTLTFAALITLVWLTHHRE